MSDGSNPLEPTDPDPPAAQRNAEESILGPGDIENLLEEAASAAKGVPATPGPAVKTGSAGADSGLARGDIEYLLAQAEHALASINSPVEQPDSPPVQPFKLQDFTGAPASADSATIDLIRDVELDLKIELGRTEMYLEDVLKLRKGSVVPLDKLAGDPVDVYVNGRLIARGEVLVLNDNFCVRVAELVASENAA